MATKNHTVNSNIYAQIDLNKLGVSDDQTILIQNIGNRKVEFFSSKKQPLEADKGYQLKPGSERAYLKASDENLYVRKLHSFDPDQTLIIEV